MRIKGLTHKMKNRVRELGDDWVLVKADAAKNQVAISPRTNRDPSKPYIAWLTPGIDFEVVEDPDAS